MPQDDKWLAKFNEVKSFVETNHRNPSKHDPEERFKYYNWLKQQKKLMNAGVLDGQRLMMFNELVALSEQYRRKNQYE